MSDYSNAYDESFSSDKSGTYLFISIDIVNSTKMKSEHYSDWPLILINCIRKITEIFLNNIDDVMVWKYLGDEVLFTIKLGEFDLQNRINQILNAHQNVIELLKELEYEDHYRINKKVTIYIKNSIWIAEIIDYKYLLQIKNYSNVFIRNIYFHDEKRNIDYLGVDIDAGFRQSKYCIKNHIIISPPLAYILSSDMHKKKNPREIPEIHIGIYNIVKMKGVWNGRGYPIIYLFKENIYYSPLKFEYDEHLDDENVYYIAHNEPKKIDLLPEMLEAIHEKNYWDVIINLMYIEASDLD